MPDDLPTDDRPLSDFAPARPRPAPTPALIDAWPDARPIPLDGGLERNGFTPIWTSILVFVVAFVAFQVIGGLAMAIGILPGLLASGQTDVDGADIAALMGENMSAILAGNTVGQFLGFGALALIVARLHSSRPGAFLRLRAPDGPGFLLAGVGWLALVPAIQWLGRLNAKLPQPEWLSEMERMQMEMIEGALMGGELSTGFLFVALALTPAICEELLFRGYLQRQVERKWGLAASVVLVGVFFGLYHLRLTQVVPLSLLGIWMGYTVWATGSLWTGAFVHLLNNGLAVLASAYVGGRPDLDLSSIEEMAVPWYAGLGGLVAAAALGRLIWLRRASIVGTTADARVVDEVTDYSAPSPLVPTST